MPSSLLFDNKGNLFISYYGIREIGFSILDTNGNWQHYSKSNSKLPDNSIAEMKMDKSGNIWMTTDKGLVKYNNLEITAYQLRDESLENLLYGIAIEDNTIWITSCFGLIKFNE